MQYCVLKGYLRRVRDYRISSDESNNFITGSNNPNASDGNNTTNNNSQSNGSSSDGETAKLKMKNTLRDLCDGTNDSDSLACLGYGKYNMYIDQQITGQ